MLAACVGIGAHAFVYLLFLFLSQVKHLEEKLKSCGVQKEITALRRKLELVEDDKKESSIRCSKAEQEVKDLRFTGED